MSRAFDHGKALEFNRLWWDERAKSHGQSPMYQRHADQLRGGHHCLSENAIQYVGNVEDMSLVHLQCHMGMETLSWSRLGADVVGLDFSKTAIETAEALCAELGLDARFVHANVYEAATVIGQTFDTVFVSVGSLGWLPDIDHWSRVVFELLRPGGRLYLNEVHPFTCVFDDHPLEPGLQIKYPYLDAGSMVFDDASSYADPGSTFENTRTIEYLHTIGSVTTSLINSGLIIDRLEEFAQCPWPRFEIMEQTGSDDWAMLDPVLNKLPNTYTLLAHKPLAHKPLAHKPSVPPKV